jgi:cysteine desulfurase
LIDLDNNATTRPAPEVVAAMARCMQEAWQNPSSVHRGGQEARRLVELARVSVAGLIGAKPREVTFTSGGTESIDLAIRGTVGRLALGGGGVPVLVTTGVEHSAVGGLVEELVKQGACTRRLLAVDGDGRVRMEGARQMISGAAIVSVQWANNETGVIQPIGEIAALCREAGATLHCDGTQWVGKMPTDVAQAGVDLLTFSPHKFHGPKGVGVLWQRAGVQLRPVLMGTQEQGRRGGTENVPGIVGAGVAAGLAREFLAELGLRVRLGEMRDAFERRVVELTGGVTPGVRVNSAGSARLWNTSNIAFAGLEAEALLLALSERGVLASAGAACSSGSLEPSPVLLAMGIEPRVAHGSIRFSISRDTTWEELERAAGIIAGCVGRLAGVMPGGGERQWGMGNGQ